MLLSICDGLVCLETNPNYSETSKLVLRERDILKPRGLGVRGKKTVKKLGFGATTPVQTRWKRNTCSWEPSAQVFVTSGGGTMGRR